MRKLKRLIPLIMTAMLLATSIPMVAGATSDAGTSTQTTDESSKGTEDTGTGNVADSNTTSDNNNESNDTTDKNTVDDENKSDEDDSKDTEDVKKDTVEDDDKKEQTEVQPKTSDSDKVVTLGADLSDDQKATMYKYFNVEADDVNTIEVTHADEVKYMEGVATAAQIGSKTLSCAYVEPTESGGVQVKTANLDFVTCTMIASALTTAGMENCNVVAACPIKVSGTGALTGIMMAYETASGEALDEGKKEAATTELMLTGALADQIGEEAATEVVAEAKTEILDKKLTDPEEIGAAVDKIAANHDATLTDDQRSQIVSLLETMSKYDYDLSSISNTLDGLNEKVGGIAKAWDSVKSFFVGSDDTILNDTDDNVLGEDVVVTSTVEESKYKDGLFTRIKNFFTGGEDKED